MNRRITTGLTICAVCFLSMVLVPNLHGQQGNNGESEVQRGFDIAPVTLNLAGKNRSLVGLGSYYVNGVSDCVGCHTADMGEYLGVAVPSDRSSAAISRLTTRAFRLD